MVLDLNSLTRPSNVDRNETWIYASLDYGYLGIDPARRLVGIFPVTGPIPLLGRVSGLLSIEYRSKVLIRLPEHDATHNCCILCLDDREACRSFESLTRSLSAALSGRPEVTARDFGIELANWERLFQKRRRLTPSEERGLWGELHFICRSPEPDKMVAHWQGPSAEDFDFLFGDTALEVKTSSRRGRHTLSHRQSAQSNSPDQVYLVSIWAAQDSNVGLTLPAVIADLSSRLTDTDAFERKLLETGYSHADRNAYTESLHAMCEPEFFDMFDVPRIREMDPGVTNVVYDVQLDWNLRIADERKAALMSKLP